MKSLPFYTNFRKKTGCAFRVLPYFYFVQRAESFTVVAHSRQLSDSTNPTIILAAKPEKTAVEGFPYKTAKKRDFDENPSFRVLTDLESFTFNETLTAYEGSIQLSAVTNRTFLAKAKPEI